MDFNELYKLKIAALLHDPPHKPFALRNNMEEASELAERLFGSEISNLIYDSKVSLADKVAYSFDRWILGILMGENWNPELFKCEVVKIKNITAPTLEKEIHRDQFISRKGSYEEYVEELRNAMKILDEWRLRYHLLYLLYEPSWILKGLPWSPADTRVPTYSVFDHDYATAAMINWTFKDSKRISGLLVGIDIPGVREFIASSQKLRDAWISSYIVSALMWYTIIDLIDKLGPDIVLMPSLRTNIFYSYWLREKLTNHENLKDLRDKIDNVERFFYISEKVFKMYRELGIPPYPITPGRATLVLPPVELLRNSLGINDLEGYLTERFRTGWKLLWEITKKYVYNKAQNDRKDDLLWSFAEKVFDYYDTLMKNTNFDKYPPLSLRIYFVEINDDSSNENLWLIYDKKYRELVNKLSLSKYRREVPETKLGLYDMTTNTFERLRLGYPKLSAKGFDYCTLCGRLPAMVVLPAKEQEDGNLKENEYGFLLYCAAVEGKTHEECNRLFEKGGESLEMLINEFDNWLKYNRDQLKFFKQVFSPGERLCSWCFIKRILSLEPRLLKILLTGGNESKVEEVVKKIDGGVGKRTWFPSTAHISSTRLYEKISDLDHKELEEFLNELASIYPKPTLGLRVTWTWHFIEKVHEKLNKKIKDRDITKKDKQTYEIIARTLIQADPEDLWFNPDRRKEWRSVLGRKPHNLSKWLWRYYTLIRADGDSIGDLLEGKLTAFLLGRINRDVYDKALLDHSAEGVHRRDLEEMRSIIYEYILNSYECEFKKFIEFSLSIIRGDYRNCETKTYKEDLAKAIASSKYGDKVSVDEALKRIDRVIEILRSVTKVPRIIVSPSYHVSLSGALMRAAMLDIALVVEFDGIVVYTGGDDLMAFAPVDKALDIVYNTRRSFAGAPVDISLKDNNTKIINIEGGFLHANNSYLPLMPNVGRSYCIYIAHYHYPLSVAVTRSSELLNRVKEKLSLRYVDYNHGSLEKAEKDMVIIAYNPRAATEDYAVLPLTWKRPIISGKAKEEILKIACLPAFSNKLLGLIDERLSSMKYIKLNHSLLYDVGELYYAKTLTMLTQEAESIIDNAYSALELYRSVIKELIKRNARSRVRADNLADQILQDFENHITLLSLLKEEDKSMMGTTPLFLNCIDVVRLIRSGMR